jgi:predicted TIM-barrel fold metal-dependent hydrolase
MRIVDANISIAPPLQQSGAEIRTLVPASTPREVIAMLDRYDIAKAIIFAPRVAGQDAYDLNYSMGNKAVADCVRAYPDRLIGFARINPSGFTDATNEIIRCKDEYGFRGLMLHGEWDYYFPGGVQVQPYLGYCQAWGWPVFYHTGTWPLTQPSLLMAVAKQFPKLVMIASHFGYSMVDDALTVANLCPNVYLTTSADSPASIIQEAIEVCGPKKIVYGSGAPYAYPDHVYDKVRKLIGISDADREAILGGTISRLLNLN